MDDFARLRQKVYLDSRGTEWDSVRDELSQLGRALLGDVVDRPDIRNLLDAAALRRAGPGARVLELIPSTGSAPYLDRYIADAIMNHPEIGADVDRLLAEQMARTGNRTPLVRLAAAAGRHPFATGLVQQELEADTPERRRAALAYIAASGLTEFRDTVARLAADTSGLAGDAADTLLDLYGAEGGGDGLPHPVTVVQSMFYGDPSRSGRGNSGGIGTLLRDLGSSMGEAVGGVVTLVSYNPHSATYPFVPREHVDAYHSIVRMPVRLADDTAYGFHVGYHDVRRAFARTMALYGIVPKVVHVRYLDDASLAVAREAGRLGAQVVATITPDPHRMLCDTNGTLIKFTEARALEHLNKILIGDELVSRARGLLAIGRGTMMTELLPYYPQLEDTRGRVAESIDEGVRIDTEATEMDVGALLTGDHLRHRLRTSELRRPTLLTVGRLAPVKNQVALIQGWARSAWRTHNLVIIGGDQENPSTEEAAILDQIARTVDGQVHLEGRFCHLPASPNAVVRRVQAQLTRRRSDPHFNVFVCPSIKEEFGLSIVEAMASGMVVCAPMRGGARTYIRHGINGFLIDTSTRQTLQSELDATVLAGRLLPKQVTAISQNGVATVRERYSMESVAAQFAGFYERVQDA